VLVCFRVFLQPEGCAPTASMVFVRGDAVQMYLLWGGRFSEVALTFAAFASTLG